MKIKLRTGRYAYQGIVSKVRQVVAKIMQESEQSLFHVLVLEDLALMPYSRGSDVQDATKTFLEKRYFWPIGQDELEVLRAGLILDQSTGFCTWRNPVFTEGPTVRLTYDGGQLVWVKQRERARFEDRMSSIPVRLM